MAGKKSPAVHPVAGSAAVPTPEVADVLAALGGASAPIIFADHATTFGCNEGVTNITLQAVRYVMLPSGLTSDSIPVAHLRLTDRARRSLRNLLDELDQREAEQRRKAN